MNYRENLVGVFGVADTFFNHLHLEVELNQQEKQMESANVCLQAAIISMDWEHLNRDLVIDLAKQMTKNGDGPLRVARRLLQMFIVELGPDNYQLFRTCMARSIEFGLGEDGSEAQSLVPREAQRTTMKRVSESSADTLFKNDPWLLPLYVIFLMGTHRFELFISKYSDMTEPQE